MPPKTDSTKLCLYISSRPWLAGVRASAWKHKMSLSRFFVTAANFFMSTKGTREKMEKEKIDG